MEKKFERPLLAGCRGKQVAGSEQQNRIDSLPALNLAGSLRNPSAQTFRWAESGAAVRGEL